MKTEEKDAIYEAVRAELSKIAINYVKPDLTCMGISAPESGEQAACLTIAALTARALQKFGPLVRAGDLYWPIVDPKDDDGVSPRYFGYQADEAACAAYDPDRFEANVVPLPEMHVWVWLSHTGQLVDFSTFDLPAQCERIGTGKVKWAAAPPPRYVWCRPAQLPARVVYQHKPAATLLARRLVGCLSGEPMIVVKKLPDRSGRARGDLTGSLYTLTNEPD